MLCIRDVKNYLIWYLLGIGSALHFEIDDLKNISNKVSYALLIILFASWSVLIFFTGNDGRLGSGLLSLSFLLLISSKIEWGGYSVSAVEILVGKLGTVWPVATALMFITGFIIPLLLACCVNRIENKSKLKMISRCIGL